jgi:hypothetical protein
VFSPNLDGLNTDFLGPTALVVQGAFTFPTTGAGNYLDFGNTDKAQPKGTLKLFVFASSASSSNIHSGITDAGALVGFLQSQALTPTPSWYEVNSGASMTTGGGAVLYADSTDVHLYAAVLSL